MVADAPSEEEMFSGIRLALVAAPEASPASREASLSEAKEQFLRNWQKCRTDSIPASRRDVFLGFVEAPDQKAAEARTPSDVAI
jgi:hypothetical protein